MDSVWAQPSLGFAAFIKRNRNPVTGLRYATDIALHTSEVASNRRLYRQKSISDIWKLHNFVETKTR